MSNEKNRPTRVRAEDKSRSDDRPERIPVSGSKDILTVKGRDDGFVYRWVNDEDDRLYRFERGGYDFVSHDASIGTRGVDTSSGTSTVISKNMGKGVTAYLMRLPRELFDEDQKAKAKRIDAIEDTMKKALKDGSSGDYGSVDFD